MQKGEYEEAFAKNPPNAVFSVYYHQFDAAGAGDKVFELNMVKSQINVDEMMHLITSEPIAHIPWAVKPEMPQALRENIQHVLLKLNDTVQGQSILHDAQLTAIRIAADAEYDPHRAIIQSVFGESY